MWRYCAFLLLLLFISITPYDAPFALAGVPNLPNGKVVNLGYATYQSDLSLAPGVTTFYGIRFAAPPTGQLRWQKPQPPATVPGIQNATTPPNQCFQSFLLGAQGTSLTNPFRGLPVGGGKKPSLERRQLQLPPVGDVFEDCLFLNVHVPTQAPKGLLPVIVYIHGGAYDAGNATLPSGHDFVVGSNFQLISVNIQYRLGVFGFLPGNEVFQKGALNAGLLDQNFALQWVQQHISKFGGDPTKVTIWGQSAGAGSVLQHIVAHAGNTQPPLFRAAMMNSVYLPPQYNYNDPIPENIFSSVVSIAGCSGASDKLACLRSAPPETLQTADTQIGQASFLGTYSVLPVVDGSFIVERPTVTLKRGRVNGKAALLSNNANEGGLFVPPSILTSNNMTLENWVTQMFPRFSQFQIGQTVALYSKGGPAVPDQASAIMGDSLFNCPAEDILTAFGPRGFKALFAIPPAFHADDLPYEFPTIAIPRNFDNPTFVKSWQQSFLSVALSLDPNAHFDKGDITPLWPSWAPSHSEMLFNMTTTRAPLIKPFSTSSTQLTRCLFWASMAATNSQ